MIIHFYISLGHHFELYIDTGKTSINYKKNTHALQLEFISDFWGDVLETDGGAWDAFEPHSIEGQSGQLAHLHLPLH